ncbi:hypothetical protein OAS47_01505 [Pelagibacteraceae bacterium]|nr:hypothetical protein [Pelagibacteraceae bacterium]
MKQIQFLYKILILQIFLFISIINIAYSKNLDKYNTEDKISNYFSGILSLNSHQYIDSYKYLKQLKGLEDSHTNYSEFYQYTLVNLGKFEEAYKYAKKIEKKNISSFETSLIIGIYYLKNKNYELASKYFQKLENYEQNRPLLKLIAKSLNSWVEVPNNKIEKIIKLQKNIPEQFESIKKIQMAFLHCSYDSSSTEDYFEKLVMDENNRFSRYNYFYANYLYDLKKLTKSKKIINEAIKKNPNSLILNQFKKDLNSKNTKKITNKFNCKNISNIVAEVFYILSNSFSAQSAYALSNFYLNIAKFLNPNFISFETLQAENFLMVKNYYLANKIYKNIMSKNDNTVYRWYAAKQSANILNIEKKDDQALKLVLNFFSKIKNPSINEMFDYAKILKNNEKYKESIFFFDKVLDLISEKHNLYPSAKEGRGIAHERIDNWKQAERDFLDSLRVQPDQPYVINYLAYSWIEKSMKINQSLKLLKKANELKKNDGYIVDSLGWAMFKLKKYNEANKYLQQAVSLMPADPIVNDHYGDSLWMNNKKIQARYYWGNVLKLEKADNDLKKLVKKKLIMGIVKKTQ